MGGGETYVEITGGAVDNGIMTLAGSTEGGGGEEMGSRWLRWTSGGFTDIDWYTNETPIDEWWGGGTSNGVTYSGYYTTVNNTLQTTYTGSMSDLAAWIDTYTITDLSAFFDTWDSYSKGNFLYTHRDVYNNCSIAV